MASPNDAPEIAQKNSKTLHDERDELNRVLITITVDGSSGERFAIIPGADMDAVFSSLNLPPKITKIRFDNWSHFQLFFGKLPNYRMTFELDFKDLDIWKLAKPSETGPFDC